MSGVEGKTAVVTGAGGGNGSAIAAALCLGGARVVCADIDGVTAARTADELSSRGADTVSIAADHSIMADCRDVVSLALSTYGSLDVLVNNAGAGSSGAALDVTEDDLMRQLRANLLGPLFMSQAALPPMTEQHAGSIVMIASIAGVAARPRQASYVVSKHAVVGLMRSLALDYGHHGIRVNAICPEFIRTGMTKDYIATLAERRSQSPLQTEADLGQIFPLRRLGEPSDVAAATLHLASDESAWMSGQTYVLDGGLSLVRPQAAVPARP